MPNKSQTGAVYTVGPAPHEHEPPRNLVVCGGLYFVVTRLGYLWPISARVFEKRRGSAPVVTEYFDTATLNKHWRMDGAV
jgi:hypothetical protein